MTKKHPISLHDRIIKEINSTYKSIETYKNHTSKTTSDKNSSETATAKRRIQVVEHKLKALKMMLAKIDSSEQIILDRNNKIR